MTGAIRNVENYAKAALRRRTERFNSCFPRGITMGDIDSHVEINHHWLFMEYKLNNQHVERGQWLDLSRLADRPRMSVWILWTTEDGFITHGQRIGVHPSRVIVTEEQVAQKIKEWVASVEQAKKPSSLDLVFDRLAAVAHLDMVKSRIMAEVVAGLSAEVGCK